MLQDMANVQDWNSAPVTRAGPLKTVIRPTAPAWTTVPVRADVSHLTAATVMTALKAGNVANPLVRT